MFDVRLLGPVQVIRAGREVALGGPKQRAVLALLLMEKGRVVPAERLAEELWRGRPPPGAAKTLRSYVSRLRGLLAPEAVLIARGGGYLIDVDPGLVDAERFQRLAAAGHDALSGGDAATAGSGFREGLALWHGRALTGVGAVGPLELESARLEDQRLAALEGRVEADIELGRHAEVTGELERLVAEYPLRERLWRLLVLALYRGERQADALAAYRRARDLLASELGLEPGEELRSLEQAVLRQEVPAAAPAMRHNLPAPLTSFLGREQDLVRLERLLDQARLVTLTGTAGTGKTRLALEAGARVAGRFRDGVWLAELAGVADSAQVTVQVMEALGVRQQGGVPVLEALAHRLRSAELLLVLDNCEHLLEVSAELAGALLRASPGLRVLATSREPLGIPGEVAWSVRPLELPAEGAGAPDAVRAPAIRLFLDRGSAARGRPAGAVAPVAVAERICRKLDGLPLAIELAAARLGTLSAAEIEVHLADRFRFLAYRRPTTDPRHQALQTAMDWSYELLAAEERRFLGELSVFAGSFGLAQVAEVCCGGDQLAALEVIDRLATKSLVAAEPAEDGTRYRLLETVRQYAADRLAEAGGTDAARQRHAGAFLNLAEEEGELAALVREHGNFLAALDWCLSADSPTGPRLARALGNFWLSRGLLVEGRDWLDRALARPSADQHLRADLLRLLGGMLYELGDLEGAVNVLSQGAAAAAAAGAPALQARIRVQLAGLHEIHNIPGGADAGALAECAAAIAVLEAEGDLDGLAEAWLLVGRIRFYRGEWPADQEALERAMAYAQRSGNRRTWITASHALGATFLTLPVPADAAVDRVEQLIQAANGDAWAELVGFMTLSLLYAYAGRFDDARAAVARSRSISTSFGAKLVWAICVMPASAAELVAGDPAAAERYLREGHEALRAMGEQGFLSQTASLLAEALYAQDRFDEAQKMTEDAEAGALPNDLQTRARWQSTRARLLARRGQFPAARALLDEAETLFPPACRNVEKAGLLMTKAMVEWLAGAPDETAANLRAALRIYQDLHVVPLAGLAEAALAGLAQSAGDEQA
jgi:predicted ATPase/DNA-binding SARP family transcriptional activator